MNARLRETGPDVRPAVHARPSPIDADPWLRERRVVYDSRRWMREANIVIVDDDPGLAPLFARPVSSVRIAANADELLRLVMVRRPDLIVLNLLWQPSGSSVLLDTLRALPDIRDIPLLVLTSYLLESGWSDASIARSVHLERDDVTLRDLFRILVARLPERTHLTIDPRAAVEGLPAPPAGASSRGTQTGSGRASSSAMASGSDEESLPPSFRGQPLFRGLASSTEKPADAHASDAQTPSRADEAGQRTVRFADLDGRAPSTPRQQFEHRLHAWISERYFDSTMTVDKAARELGYSRSVLQRLMQRWIGAPFKQHLTHLRLDAARTLFDQGEENVTQCALATGFANINSFTVAFSRQFGITPKQYILRKRKG